MANLTSANPDMWSNPYEYYEWTLTISDKYTKGWLLVDSPTGPLACVALYLLMVYLGPKIMRNRKPLKLNWLLVPYNLAMAALNLFICVELMISSTKLKYSYYCEPVHESNSPYEMRIRRAVWWYYFSKLLEFTDTFFFIIRKKNQQLSFLHVYHHSTMFSFWWIGVKWVPSGSTFLPAMGNSFIHVLMYSYYGLAALGPHISKYLWWKKYLTIIQLIQFTLAMYLGAYNLFRSCDFPKWMMYTLVVYMITFLVLFGQFYVNAYIDGQKRRKAQNVDSNENILLKAEKLE